MLPLAANEMALVALSDAFESIEDDERLDATKKTQPVSADLIVHCVLAIARRLNDREHQNARKS